jgi:hypothetical protein
MKHSNKETPLILQEGLDHLLALFRQPDDPFAGLVALRPYITIGLRFTERRTITF